VIHSTQALRLVDQRRFRDLFIDVLGWSNPNQRPLTVEADGREFTLTQVASYKGLAVWWCDQLPSRKAQRLIDQQVGLESHERLLIFSDHQDQAWRWPRRAQLGAANAKLVLHNYKCGSGDARLGRQLAAIAISFDEQPTLVELLDRMRAAFDYEAETASAQAARLMGALYVELESAGWDERNATLLLARLLFLWFADDTAMWRANPHAEASVLFQPFVVEHTSAETFLADLAALFEVLDCDEGKRKPGTPAELDAFRYVNGGLFHDALKMGRLTPAFRQKVIEAGDFDWSVISPAVFGSMFQTVNDKKARRAAGEHYTTEESILKTIGPLFLDELRERLESSRGDRGQLTKLHNELGRIRVLDPACGCGNFLIVAYRELRAIEQDLLLARRDLDISEKGIATTLQSVDVTLDLNVSLDHFYGIEINEWPARIAETAMLLVDHLANLRMQDDFGIVPDRLPIRISPTIVHANALHHEWAAVVEPGEDVIVVGNPPFIGQYTKTAEQTADTKRIWGAGYNGYLDYVTCWYALALKYYGEHSGRWAFVSTNSIAQGEAAEYLFRPIFDRGWRIKFAHRSFQWTTEAADGAAVHVSVIGFDARTDNTPRAVLWAYPEGGRGVGQSHQVSGINAYLLPAPRVFVSSVTHPLSATLPKVIYGSKPTDDGNFFVGAEELPAVRADSTAGQYLRQFVGARELLHGIDRWCLWLEGVGPNTIAESPVLTERVDAVRAFRLKSLKAATRAKAATPHLFDERRQPKVSYLGIPRHVGETREYFTAKRLPPEVICGDANFMVEDPDGFALGILSSTMFILWMRAIGGRLESRLRFSNTFVYNSFPLPTLSDQRRSALVRAAAQLTAARAQFPGKSLADLYEPGRLPEPVLEAHVEIDKIVDAVFGVKEGATVEDRQRLMLRRYAGLTQQETDTALFELDLPDD
jgi:hypothetical protein